MVYPGEGMALSLRVFLGETRLICEGTSENSFMRTYWEGVGWGRVLRGCRDPRIYHLSCPRSCHYPTDCLGFKSWPCHSFTVILATEMH